MAGAAGSRWQKALGFSLCLHVCVLIGGGWLAGQALQPVPVPETLIELELASESAGASPVAAAAESANPLAVPNMSETVPVQQVPATEAAVAEPVVAVSAMAMVAVDSGASQSAGQSAGGGTSGGGNSQGSGVGIGGGTGSGKAGGVIPPGILSRREPNYPEAARKAGIEGTVVLKIEILENGRAGQVSVHRSSGSELLDEAAAAAVERWRFVPAKLRETGQSIACQTTMPVVFKLRT